MKKFWKSLGKGLFYAVIPLLAQVLAGFLLVLAAACMVLAARPELIVKGGGALRGEVSAAMVELLAPGANGMLWAILTANLGAVLLVWFFFHLGKKRFFREIRLVPTSRHNLIGALLYGLSLSVVVGSLTELIPFPEELMDSFTQSHGELVGHPGLLPLLTVGFVAPLTEEIFFRGLVYTRLRQGMAVLPAMALSALLFGLAHGEPIWILIAFLSGLGLVWIFECTGSLWCAILAHGVNNVIAQTLTMELSFPAELALTLCCGGLMVLVIRDLKQENAGSPVKRPVAGRED